MRISKADAEKNRTRLIDVASRILREQGIEGVGVDALAKAAGVTHGGVYSHFKSKDDLAAAALERALNVSKDEWSKLIEGKEGADALNQLIRSYVSRSHRDNPGLGCSIATLGAEAARGGRKLRETVARGVAGLIEEAEKAGPAHPDASVREAAIANVAAMMGAIVMARAAASDPALSDEILAVVRRDLMARNADR